MNMERDIFAEQPYGKVALKKLGNVSENFRLYAAGWLGDGKEREVMEIHGAEFRRAKTGKNKGLLSIMVKGTKRTVYVTKQEM